MPGRSDKNKDLKMGTLHSLHRDYYLVLRVHLNDMCREKLQQPGFFIINQRISFPL